MQNKKQDNRNSDKPIRILQVLSSLNRGGAESYVMNIYRHIDRSKVQFDFAVHTKEKGDFDSEVLELGGRIFYFPRFTSNTAYKYVKSWANFLNNNYDYCAVHCHVRSTASIIISLAKLNNIATIAHSHSTSSGKGFSSFIKNIFQIPIKYIADNRVACSDVAGKWLFGNKEFKIFFNSIDSYRFKYNNLARKTIREEFSVDDRIFIGHIGNFTYPKNHMFLLNVFNEIVKINPRVRFILVGDGELKQTVYEEIHRLGLEDYVLCTGTRTDISKILSALDLLLFPSIYEGLPVTLVEAQASGLKCLVSKNVTKEISVTDLVHFMELNSDEEWAKKAIELIDNSVDITDFRMSYNDLINKSVYNTEHNIIDVEIYYLNVNGA